MAYKAKIICDSVSPVGKRLTTFEITFPRIVLAEAKTHRVIRGMGGNVEEELWTAGLGLNDDENLSRNSASSRAIPVAKMIQRVMEDPFIPERFPVTQKGMQPAEYYEPGTPEYERCVNKWLEARDDMVAHAGRLLEFRVHKQIANRLLELFSWHTAVVTATEWNNFFGLRCHPDAQAEIRTIANMMYDLYRGDTNWEEHPAVQPPGRTWHCPYIDGDDLKAMMNWYLTQSTHVDFGSMSYEEGTTELMKRISVARCARTSYLNQDGKKDIEEDLSLYSRLQGPPFHASPFEHVATPHFMDFDHIPHSTWSRDVIDDNGNIRSGNFMGWKQLRKFFPDENIKEYRRPE